MMNKKDLSWVIVFISNNKRFYKYIFTIRIVAYNCCYYCFSDVNNKADL